jgi:uncharacterized membrane protein
MASSQKTKKRKSGGSQAKKAVSRTRAAGRAKSGSPGEYAREAFTEWRKAARFGAAALVASGAGGAKSKSKAEKPPLKERLNPATTEKGGKVGDAADNLLSKLGALGKAASKLSLGSRVVDKVVPDAVTKLQPSGEGKGASRDGSPDHPPVPIQESIDLAVPIRSAFALATRFEDFPQWSDRIENAEEIDKKHVGVDLKLRGVQRSAELEITDLHPPLRIEWEATEGTEHGGMLTFHELAPSLTHIELSLDVEPESPVQRLTRSIHLPDRAIRSELHRFKAWAELWQEVEAIEPPEEESEEDLEDEPEDELEEEPEDELEEGPEDEFEDEPEDELEEEPEDELEEGPEDEFEEEPEDEFEEEPEDERTRRGWPSGRASRALEEEPEDEFEDDEDFDEELDEEGEPAGTR